MADSIDEVHGVLKNLQDSLVCPICRDLLDDPARTRCGHYFCTLCVSQLTRKRPTGCPLCKARLTRRSYASDPLAAALVEQTRGLVAAISQDTGFDVSPSKYRPRPSVEANDVNQEATGDGSGNLMTPRVYGRGSTTPADGPVDADGDLLSISQHVEFAGELVGAAKRQRPEPPLPDQPRRVSGSVRIGRWLPIARQVGFGITDHESPRLAQLDEEYERRCAQRAEAEEDGVQPGPSTAGEAACDLSRSGSPQKEVSPINDDDDKENHWEEVQVVEEKPATPGTAEKRIFKTRSPQVPQLVQAASTSVEAAIEGDDPYQFISSQKTPPKKKQRKTRAVKKLGTDGKANTRRCLNKKTMAASGSSNNQEEAVASTSGNVQPDEPIKEKKKHIRQAAKKPIPPPALFVDCEDSPIDDSQEDPSFMPVVPSHRPKSKLGRQTAASASKPKMVTGKQLLGGATSGTASQEVRAIGELFDNVAQVACAAAQTRDRSVSSTSMTRAESLRQLDIEAATARQPETPRSVTFSERVDVREFEALNGSSPSVAADRSVSRVTSGAAEPSTEPPLVSVDRSVSCVTTSAAEPSTELPLDDVTNESTQDPRRPSAATSPGWSKLPGLGTAFGIKSKLCVTGGGERADGIDQSRPSLERAVTQEIEDVSPTACIQEVASDIVSSSDAEESAGFDLKDIELAAEKALRCQQIIGETCENAKIMPNYSGVRVVVETPASDRAPLAVGECASDDCAIASGPMMSESPTTAVQPTNQDGPGLEAMEVELCADFVAGTVSSGILTTTESCNQYSNHRDSDDRQKLSVIGASVLPPVSASSRKSTSSMDITAVVSCDVHHQSSVQSAGELDTETAVRYSTAEKSTEVPKMTATGGGCRLRSARVGSPQGQLSDPFMQHPSSTGPRGGGAWTGNHRRHRPTNYSRQLRQLVRNQQQLTAVVTQGFEQLLSLLGSRKSCPCARSPPPSAAAVPSPLTPAERFLSAGVSVPPVHSDAVSIPVSSQSFAAKRFFSRSAPVSPSLVLLTDRLLDGGPPTAVSATAAAEAAVGVVDHSPGGGDVVSSSAGEPTPPLGLTALLMERPFVPSAPVSSAGPPPTISVTQMERVADEMAVELVEAAAPPDSGPPVGSEEMRQCELYDAELAADDDQPVAGSDSKVAPDRQSHSGDVDDCSPKRPSGIDGVVWSGAARRSSGRHKRTSSVSSVASSKSQSTPKQQVNSREDVDCKRPRLMSEEHCDEDIIDGDNQYDAVMRTPVRPGSSPSSKTACEGPGRRETCEELGVSSPSGVCGNDWQDDVFSPGSTPARLEAGSRRDSASDAMEDGGVCRLTPSHDPVPTSSSKVKQPSATTEEPSDVEVRPSKQQRVSSVAPASPYAGLRRSLGRSSLLPSPAAASPLEHRGSGVARGNPPSACSPRRARRSSVRRSIADTSDVSSASPLLRVESHRRAQLTSDDIDASPTTPLSASPLQRLKPRRHPQVISEDLDDTPGSPLSVFSIEDVVDDGDGAPIGEGGDGRNVSTFSAASAQDKTVGMLDDTEMIQMVDNCKDPVEGVLIVESDDELPSPAPVPVRVSRDRSSASRSRSPRRDNADSDESKHADSVEGNSTMLDDEADVFSDTVPASPAELVVTSLQHAGLRQNGHDAHPSVALAVEETPDDVTDVDEPVLQDPSTQDMEIPDGFFNDSVIGPSGRVSDIPPAARAEVSDHPAAAVSEDVVQRLTAPVKPPRASMTAAAGGPPPPPPGAEAVAVAATDGDGCVSEAESEEMFLASRPTVDQPPARRPPVVVVSGLKRTELEAVQRLLASHSGRFCKTWDDSVTHVVVKTAENLEAGRTLKYLQGVAAGSWVVSYCWVADSLEAGTLLDESRYEALDEVSSEGGARRSRLRQQNLFNGFTFCCVEPFRDVTLEQLQSLIRLSGGLIIDSLAEMADQRAGTRLIVAQDDLDVDFEQWRRDHGAACVAYEWLVDCVATYRPWSLLDTTLCGATAAELSALTVPDQWCQPETQDTVFFDTMGL